MLNVDTDCQNMVCCTNDWKIVGSWLTRARQISSDVPFTVEFAFYMPGYSDGETGFVRSVLRL